MASHHPTFGTPDAPRRPSTAARVFMFPGQSSVGPDVVLAGAAWRTRPPSTIADRARAVLGEARASEYLDAGGARLRSNRDTQISVFLATQMYLAAMRAEGIEAGSSLGLSLGEYSHLVHIGALDLDEALRLVDERGRCYDEAPPGIMATVLAVDHDTVASVVERARAYGAVAISNINAPTQHVIAGAEPAVAWAAATLEDEHAAHVTIIERRVPMHSPMMAAVADGLRAGVGAGAVADARRTTTCRTSPARRSRAPTAADFVSHLTASRQRAGAVAALRRWPGRGRPGRDVHRSRPGRRAAQHDGPRVAQRPARARGRTGRHRVRASTSPQPWRRFVLEPDELRPVDCRGEARPAGPRGRRRRRCRSGSTACSGCCRTVRRCCWSTASTSSISRRGGVRGHRLLRADDLGFAGHFPVSADLPGRAGRGGDGSARADAVALRRRAAHRRARTTSRRSRCAPFMFTTPASSRRCVPATRSPCARGSRMTTTR